MSTSLRIPADLDHLAAVRRFVEETATALGSDPEATADMVLAMNEAVTNIIVHGYQGQPGDIEIEAGRSGDALVLCLRDQARAYDPTQALSPDITAPLEKRPFGGMGVHMMRVLLDEVSYRLTPQGSNELTLVKNRAITS